MGDQSNRRLASHVLRCAGPSYAEEAGIRLADKPMPLFQLLVLALLLSTRISADIAVDASAEFNRGGLRTARTLAAADRRSVIDALGRAHYRRYDESTATRLHDTACLALGDYCGDLRRLAEQAAGDPDQAAQLLQRFPGIGPTGADIFLREVQSVWPWVIPHFDTKAQSGARSLRLTSDPRKLAGLVRRGEIAQFAAGLVRVSLDRDARDRVLAARD